MKPENYEQLREGIKRFEEEAERIRAEKHDEYGFHFYENFDENGLLGYIINDSEIGTRIKSINKNGVLDEKSLKNALLDRINYAFLVLFWLEREEWNNKCKIVCSDELDNNNHYAFVEKFDTTGRFMADEIKKDGDQKIDIHITLNASEDLSLKEIKEQIMEEMNKQLQRVMF